MRKVVPAGAVLVAAALVGVWWLLREADPEAGALLASGTVEATEAHLGFQLPGRLEAVGPREGETVEAGAVLAWLGSAELDARVAGADAAMDGARARLQELERGSRPQEIARLEAALRAATEARAERVRDVERARRLHEGGAISRETLERAETARALAEAAVDEAMEALELVRQGPRTEQLDAQRAQLRQADAAREQARAALDNARIVAPFGGVVALRHREPGEIVAPGAPVLTLRNLEDRWVRIYVPGNAIGRVHLGQGAEIRGDADPERRYRGEVSFIGSEAEFTPRNVQTPEERTRLVYPVRVRILDDPAVDLKPGLPVDVRLLEGAG